MELVFFVASLLLSTVSGGTTGNPADELVAALNANRTALKLASLHDNPGLGCMALQYIKAYQGRCDEANDKKPADADFAQTFAPNCGVEPSSLAQVTGRLLGCQSSYVHATEAFSNLLIHNNKSLAILYNKNHTEVGAGVSGTDGGAPYFWCVLFSNGASSSSFVLPGGVASKQRPGCYSGTNETCSGAMGGRLGGGVGILGLLLMVGFGFAL
ncbi:uncharacterized protein LOC18439442 [Amborella trichopoda]|uniref:SCP domain-containing protein n=1 Tax=Amborella trichopoda TaxID=13333 RepID=W1PU92_AMBTC|nr:uncharacterized protein LOC18439442 [Amborella trichopoda]ERN11251.1 hypothetical protein AMTR_s00024p00232320 [Amborella trichopoda]|eukprot:XP_006849670.1 uncharacterized protein LOC18439442 [Amborella trichopoda]